MFFVIVCVIQIICLIAAYSYVCSDEKVPPWHFFWMVLTAIIYAIPAAYKISFGG